MAYLKYYRDEVDRHPALNSVHVEFDEARAITKILCKILEVAAPTLGRVRGNRNPKYLPTRRKIMLHAHRGTLLHLVHELAHHLDHLKRPGQRLRRHGKPHAKLVDKLARQLTKLKGIDGNVKKSISRDLGFARRREKNPYRMSNFANRVFGGMMSSDADAG